METLLLYCKYIDIPHIYHVLYGNIFIGFIPPISSILYFSQCNYIDWNVMDIFKLADEQLSYAFLPFLWVTCQLF